ncbi:MULTISPECIES: PLD nuclease N-terminal domain-containing protein [Hymenobacter]|uniref:Phospholipase_D-nuclease N-terminal n=1 Tax=Hymenobacter mucosus TaxID=1411120 RepID=A0A238WSX1_9BACT|nr:MULTISPECIES: PLD nuclease N-terminal domain-containing protein [Hymenobacter]SNR49647.1 Phospholipase_D-nuclease N-terminal [Hymenobacter mucosus]
MNKLTPHLSRMATMAPILALMLITSSCARFNADGSLATWGYVVLALDVLALFDVFRQPWSIGKKVLWAAIIFFFPLGGLILYYLFAGRGKA